MLFNSYEFLLAFLPLSIAGYFLAARFLPGRAGNAWLVAASLFFYAWWRAEFLLLLAASIAVNHAAGSALVRRAGAGRPVRGLLAAAIAFDLVLLGYFKYANFLAENFAAAFGAAAPRLDVVLPIGISFFTFTQIAFLVDCAKRKAAEPDPVNYALFVTYFPHLLAGPILHHAEMMPQFAEPANRRVNWDNLGRGLALLAIGLGKKVLVADPLAQWANAGFAAVGSLSFAEAWITILSYTMQIYFDFSGYTDMALGMALMMNIRLPLNFDSPYRSRNLREFWRRWHMTLSRFLRDYVYIPLGGSRGSEPATAAILVATFTLGGLWHGAAWTFVLWGLANGLGLVAVRLWGRGRLAMPPLAAWALTFAFVNLGWVLFRSASVAEAFTLMGTLLGAKGFSFALAAPQWAWIPGAARMDAPALLAQWTNVSTAALLVLALAITARPRNSMAIVASMSWSPAWRAATALLLAAGVLALANPTEFLYFNF